MASSLRTRISALRKSNADGQDFVPITALLNVFQRKEIVDTITECDIKIYQREEAVEVVLRGGQRVFAILCVVEKEHLIVDFMKHDNFLDAQLDSKLPFEEAMLRDIIPNDYRQFYDAQWEFSAPFFKPNLHHRKLHDRCILPFLEVKELGEGGFGVISKVALEASHQGIYPDESDDEGNKVYVIRKEVKPTSTMERVFENEKHILSLLRALRHPNIIQFYAAYTLKMTPTLLFAVADHDLAFLLAHPRRQCFATDESLYHGLSGLSSAIREVHNYFSEDYSLRLIGCHFDLKPKNILVQRDKLILADFGLSRLKSDDSGSGSNFKAGVGDYLAPECQDLRGGFEKHRIGRGSDIWSFGCILAEVATYMEHGPQGIEDFLEKRKVNFGGFLTIYAFHAGDCPNEGVIKWFDRLENSPSTNDARKGLLDLIRNMLQIAVSERPTASEVSARLFVLAQKTTCDVAIEFFALLLKDVEFDLCLEYERFKIWMAVVGLEDKSRGRRRATWFEEDGSEIHFGKIQGLLQGIREELSMQWNVNRLEPSEPGTSAKFYRLRTFIDDLWATQSPAAVTKMNSRLEDRLLSRQDKDFLGHVMLSQYKYGRVPLLVAMKEVMSSVDQYRNGDPQYLIDKAVLRKDKELNGRWLGHMQTKENNKSFVLVEFLEYEEKWISRSHELLLRVNDLVFLLSRSEMSESFPLLPCRNFSHFPERRAFGLIFELPVPSTDSGLPPRIITLTDLIKLTQKREDRPPLGDIFRLAYTLASSVLRFHKAEWLHKSISSFNLIFFSDAFNSTSQSILSPYLVGFNHSRQSNEFAFSDGPCQDVTQRDYQHPDYVNEDARTRFREEFDYYSVGIVLLELGRWRPLNSFTRGRATYSPQQIKDYLLREEVPLLSSYMGEVYRDLVLACMDGKYPRGRGTSRQEVYATFEQNVVRPLSRCLTLQPTAAQD